MNEKEYIGLSKEEIARQFELPERKSKIATLLKQDGQAYCICRSSDSSRFMIGCDSCEEWYHGDCIGINQKEAKNIKQYFCPRCKEEDPTLQTRFKPGGRHDLETRSTLENPRQKERKKRERQTVPTSEKKGKRSCGQCSNCQRADACEHCRMSKETKKFRRSQGKCQHQQCLKFVKHSGNTSRGRGRQNKVSQFRKGEDSSSDEERSVGKVKVNITGPRQCHGPLCTFQAKPDSKYCSDKCGMDLATNRIFQVLPQRIQEWAVSPCIAELMNRQQLETIRKQQVDVRAILHELDKRHKELDEILDRAKTATVAEEEEKEEDEGEMSMYCITCGHEIHSRTAIKHMEKCFNKYESQASFGSIYKTRIEGNNMFCDFYNPANRTYCKRLRVLCPEHCKDPKVTNTEVCGCPLVTNVFDLTGEFCRASKKSCVRHYCWEKLRRAEIDMERVRQWLKIDELIEQERQTRQRMSDRAGVLALMLHSTYNHEVMDQMSTSQDMIMCEAPIDEELKRGFQEANKSQK